MKYLYLICSILLATLFSSSCKKNTIRLLAGTYTQSNQKGLYLFNINPVTGNFNLLAESYAGPNPSYFCISEKRGLIYAANEVMEFNGRKGGGVTTIKYNPESALIEKVGDMLVPNGGPCYISLSPGEDYLLFANYSGSSIAVVKLDGKGIPETVTDTISFNGIQGQVSHPHMISFNPDGSRVYLTDLGLDRIVIYDFDSASGHLNEIGKGIVNLDAGSGPRHFTFNATGTKMYVICELNSTISVFDVEPDGLLKPIQHITTLGADFTGENFCADIHLAKDDRFLYGTNRGENTIVVFRVEQNGKLTLLGRTACGGNWPRNFVTDPTGRYILVANQRSGNISLFRINRKTGMPEYTDEYKLDTPACLKL